MKLLWDARNEVSGRANRFKRFYEVAAKNFPGENQCRFEVNRAVRRQFVSWVLNGVGVLGLDGANVQGCLSGGDGVLLRANVDPRENDDEKRGERGKNLNKLAPFGLLSHNFFD